MSYGDTTTLRAFVDEEGGAVSIGEATAWFIVHEYDVTHREIAELHEELDGVIVGRSRIVTPALADELQDALDEQEDEED